MSQTQTLEIVNIPVDKIKPSPYQPRLDFDLEELRGSIIQYGIRDPLKVRKVGDYWEIIDGERRWRIAQQEGLKTVPCLILDYSDEEADALSWRFNTERKDYSVEEKAKHFHEHQLEGMSARAIAQIHGYSHQTIASYLSIFRLPEKFQNYVWAGAFSFQKFEYLYEKGLLNGSTVTPPTHAIMLIQQSIDQDLKQKEFEQVVDDFILDLKEKQVEAAKKATATIEVSQRRVEKAKEEIGEPEVKEPETSEEFEEAARVLREEAKKRKTPEQILQEKREKARNALLNGKGNILSKLEKAKGYGIDTSKFEERLGELKVKIDSDPEVALKESKELKTEIDKAIKDFKEEERIKRLEEERKKIEAETKQKIEAEAKAKAREELLSDTRFVRDFIEKEYPLMREVVGIEDLKRQLMQKLLANVPEEKMERAKEIFEEEIKSLRKRIEIFPEKSAKIEPKFEYLKLMEERGVIPYTVWDFQYRDDYAGDKDFHGNCSPQVVEQCVWRLTNEGDLVLDPMAGSGTTLDVCKRYNRKCIGYDIKPPSSRTDIIRNDSRKIPLKDEFVDMIFIHPPYWNLAYFTKAEEKLPDLSRAKSAQEFLDMLKQVFQECYRTLKHGKFMCVLLGDVIREGRFIPLCRKTTNMAEEIGFLDYGYAVKLAHGEVSRKKSGVIVAEPVYTDNLKISHDLVMFFRRG